MKRFWILFWKVNGTVWTLASNRDAQVQLEEAALRESLSRKWKIFVETKKTYHPLTQLTNQILSPSNQKKKQTKQKNPQPTNYLTNQKKHNAPKKPKPKS